MLFLIGVCYKIKNKCLQRKIHKWRELKCLGVKVVKMLPILELRGLIVHLWIIRYLLAEESFKLKNLLLKLKIYFFLKAFA